MTHGPRSTSPCGAGRAGASAGRRQPQPLKWAKPSKYPVQHREAWRPRTKAPSKAEALRRLLDAINRNDEAAREMLTPRPDLLKAWLKAA